MKLPSVSVRFQHAAEYAARHWSSCPVKGLTKTIVFVDNTPEPTGLGVYYHATTVAWLDADTGVVTLKSGGHMTATTAKRMNQALSLVFKLPDWRVSRQGGEFVISGPDGFRARFVDTFKVSTR